MPNPEYVISLKTLGGSWEKVGTGQSLGITAENITHTHDLPGGPASLSFVLKRDTRVRWPDITPFTPAYCTVGGIRAWSGRITSTPTERSESAQITVNGTGYYHSHLKDDGYDKTYVIADLSRWVDARSMSGTTLGLAGAWAAGQVSLGSQLLLAFPANVAVTANAASGATLDLGPNNNAARVIVTYTSSNNDADASLVVRATTVANWFGAGDQNTVKNNAGASGTLALTPGASRRYVHIGCYCDLGHTPAADVHFKITSILVFTSTTYETGNASDLHADTVIKDALTQKAPLLSTDQTLIAAATFDIPEYATWGRKSVADIVDDVNRFHGYQARLTSEPKPRFEWRAVPTTPTWVLSGSDAYHFTNASSNDASEIYNKVRVKYQTGDGTVGEVEVTPTTDTSFLGKRGYTRVKDFDITSVRSSSAAATQIGQAYLDAHLTAPLRGSLKVVDSIRSFVDGAYYPVGAMQAGDVVLLANENDSETGSRGRYGQVAGVSYTHNDLTANITIDSRADYLDQLIERIGVRTR